MRIKKGEKKMQPAWQEKRKKKRKRRLGIEDKAEAKEGTVYAAGSFGPDGEMLQLPTSVTSEPKTRKAPQCTVCHKPRKGHRKGQGCPPYDV